MENGDAFYDWLLLDHVKDGDAAVDERGEMEILTDEFIAGHEEGAETTEGEWGGHQEDGNEEDRSAEGHPSAQQVWLKADIKGTVKNPEKTLHFRQFLKIFERTPAL